MVLMGSLCIFVSIKQIIAMSNSFFMFKQFIVKQENCAMKVGTDGILLGAWACAQPDDKILDVGAGTGLICLQMAQRFCRASIVAVEIDPIAAMQAKENVESSPWSDRIHVECCDFRNFVPDCNFDLIVSNPPYFSNGMECPDMKRNQARHSEQLDYGTLFSHSVRLLNEKGKIALIVPYEEEQTVLKAAYVNQLYTERRTDVYTTNKLKRCRRILFSFGLQNAEVEYRTLCIADENGHYTPEFIALTKEFYLNM